VGGYGYSFLIEDIVAYAISKGCVVVAARETVMEMLREFTPANIPNVIVVAASDQNDVKCYFSNYGKKVDVAAPAERCDADPTIYFRCFLRITKRH